MTKDFRNLVWHAFEEARPYLEDSSWIKALLERLITNTTDLKGLENLLKAESRSLDDIVKRTDLSIYLAYLERAARRWHSDS